MRYSILLLLPACLLGREEATRTIEKTLPLTGSSRSVMVCNISGDIQVSAAAGNEVRIAVKERLEAPTREKLEELRREVDVRFTQEAGLVRAGVKGPWSDGDCGQQSGTGRRKDWNGENTSIEHRFTVTLPRDARFEIRTVNGSIDVKETAGGYKIGAVNGSIRMTDVEGAGDVKTINGGVVAVYRKNPDGDTKFSTINGKLNLYFQPPLNADFEMKTLNGRAYTDFDMSALPSTVTSGDGKQGMKVIYRRDMKASMRAGSGGARISAETLNGDILIHSLAKGRP